MFFFRYRNIILFPYMSLAENRLELKSNEAGMKYFLMGSFASGIHIIRDLLDLWCNGSFDVLKSVNYHNPLNCLSGFQ